ncbi:MAG: RICIN domain-containing protein [Methanolobus sp.]|nr:RICIN domain-containing protein [Methanolobus sp.]
MNLKTGSNNVNYDRISLKLFAVCTILLLTGSSIYPALAASSNADFYNSAIDSADISPFEVSALNAIAQSVAFTNQRDTGIDLDALMAATTANVTEGQDHTISSESLLLATDVSDIDMSLAKYGPDSDGDGIPDTVELVLGTDINNTDSDFDRLDDLFEIENGLDPLEPDSNHDGLSDYFEIHGASSADIDGDGFENAWDLDNDNDGVIDALDLSPFSRSVSSDSFEFSISSNGNPTYLNFQIRPEDPEHLSLLAQSWDWPDGDSKGTMKDLNNSDDDVLVMPMLELTVPVDCKIISVDSGESLEAPSGEQVNVTTGNYTGSDHQLWILESMDGNYYRIVSKNDGKCLEVFNASRDDMANVTVGNYTGEDHQLWELVPCDTGLYKLISRHSGKCLEANSVVNGTVFQNACQEEAQQLWELELTGGISSDPTVLEDYGIIITLGKAYVPLSPVKDFGDTIALNGRMFFPQGSAQDTSAKAELTWMVIGQTDRPKKVSFTTNKGQYISVDSVTSNLIAGSSPITSDQMFEIVYITNNRVALKAPNGRYVYAANGGGQELIAGSTEIGQWEIFELLGLENNKISLKASNGQYVSTEGGGGAGILANRDQKGDWESFTLVTAEYESVSSPLANYNENFMLTGFSIEENCGSDFGLFFSEDMDSVFEAGFVLSYTFLRDRTPLDLVPGKLQDDYNVTISSETGFASHQDEALVKITSEMAPDALSSLPSGVVLPMIGIFEDDFRYRAMDDLAAGSYITGNSFHVDLKDQPLITTKSMKMSWYDTGTMETIATEDMLEEVRLWGRSGSLDEATLATMMNLMIAWETGESTVARIGSVETDFNFPEGNEVLDTIDSYGIAAVDLVCNLIIGGTAVYSFITFTRLEPLAPVAGQTNWKLMKAMTESVSKVRNGFLGAVNRVSSVLSAIGWVVIGVIAFYAFWSIASSEGWSGYGIFTGTMYAVLMVIYAVVLAAIGSIPVVGWAIAAFVALSDLIIGWIFGKGWSQMFFEWLIGLFTDVRVKTEADLRMLNSSVNVIDHTDNGLTEGDRIELESNFKGIITKTPGGSFTNLQNSYIRPQYRYSSSNTLAGHSSTTEGATTTYLASDYRWKKETEYRAYMWLEPEAAINFPFRFWLSTDYRVYYDKCWWLFGWHCSEKDSTGTSYADPSTLYFDVMPDNIENFVLWTAIFSNDIDGDGVINSDELLSGSSPLKGDTDNDGLSDGYEIEYGTSPVNKDTDGDGLEDGMEIFFGSSPLTMDTDGDGLEDLAEFQLSSNPLKVDTDNDGLTDFAEYEFGSDLLKPDTDDDGLFDYLEWIYSTDPLDPDTDGDGLSDGYEVHGTGTSSLSEDTDLDGLKDPEELELRTDPLSADTDNDGYTDAQEIELGTNPLLEDTDGDGIIDSLDMDSVLANVESIAVVYDMSEGNEKLLDTLSGYINIRVYSADELLLNHSDEPYILLLGRPEKVNGTAGNITYDVLINDGEILPNMLSSNYDRMAVRYGMWNSTQTVVMLSEPYMYDYCRILDAFRSRQVTTSASSIRVEYRAAGDVLLVESADSVKRTDSSVGIVLDANVTPWVSIKLLGSSVVPLSSGSGLASGEYAVGKYLDVTVSENVMNTSASIMNSTLLTIYYRSGELDRNGDGDASDPNDIDENTLCIYSFNEDTRRWTKLPYTAVSTEDIELYGESYAGYVWARVPHLSTFALAGKPARVESRGPLDSDQDGLPNVVEYRIGTDPFNPDTDGDGIIDSKDPEPSIPQGSVQGDSGNGVDNVFRPEFTGEDDTVYSVPEVTPVEQEPVPGFPAWQAFVSLLAVLSYLVIFKRKE